MGSSEAASHGIFQRRRCAQRRRTLLSFSPPPPGRTSFFTQPPAIGCRARTPRRCFPMGSSKAAFCGLLQGRRDDACRWARLRRLPTGFSNGGAARSAAVPFCPSFPRRLAVLLSLPSARTTMPHEHIPVHANRRAVPTLFHIFPARPSRASSFTLPPGQRYRARSPKQCLPKGSSEAAFCGVLKRRRCAQRRRSLFSFSPPPPGERMPRARSRPCEPAGSPYPFPHFPARPSHASSFTLPPGQRYRARTPRRCFPMGSSEAAFHGIFQRRRCAQRRRSLLSFSPPPPGERMPRVRSRPCEPAGSPFYFHSFPRASRASGRRPRTAHSPCSCARLLLFAAAPAASLLRFPPRFAFRAAHSCARVPSAPVSSVPRCLVPRRRALYPALFLRGRTHRAVLSPFPTRAARLSCPALPARPALFLRGRTHRAVLSPFPTHARPVRPPRTPCAPGLCTSRRDGGSCKASCCALRARPALFLRGRTHRAVLSPFPTRARPVRPPRTPGTSVPPRTPGASVPLLAAVRFGSHSAVQSLPIFFHRPAGKRTQKANLIRTYVRIRF